MFYVIRRTKDKHFYSADRWNKDEATMLFHPQKAHLFPDREMAEYTVEYHKHEDDVEIVVLVVSDAHTDSL